MTEQVEIVIKGTNNNTNLLLDCNDSAIGNIKKTEIIEDPLKALDKKYYYAINQNVGFFVGANNYISNGYFFNYKNNILYANHIHNIGITKAIDQNNNITFPLLESDFMTKDNIPFFAKFPNINYNHSNIIVNNIDLLTSDEINLLKNTNYLISNQELEDFCDKIINDLDSRFKYKKHMGNLENAYLIAQNDIGLPGPKIKLSNTHTILFANNKKDFIVLARLESDSELLNQILPFKWTIQLSSFFINVDTNEPLKIQMSDKLPEPYTNHHNSLPAIQTDLKLEIINFKLETINTIYDNSNSAIININFDVKGGWKWRDLTNESMQMASHVDGEGHAHIFIGGEKIGRSYDGTFSISAEKVSKYIYYSFEKLYDPLNITVALVNNMHQGYTNESLDLEDEKIYGIYYYEPIDINKIKNIPLLNATTFTDRLGNVNNNVNVILDGNTITFMSTSPSGESETYIMTSTDGITYTQMYEERSIELAGNVLKYTGSRIVLSNPGTLVGASLFNYYIDVPEALVGFLKPNEWNLSGTIS